MQQFSMKIDILNRVIVDSGSFADGLELLSIQGVVFEDSLYSVISQKIFPNLEVLRIRAPKLELKLSVIR